MWGKVRSQKKAKSKTQFVSGNRFSSAGTLKPAIFGLIILLFFLLVGRTVGFIGNLSKPLSNLPTVKKYSWDNDVSLNVVFASKVPSDLTFVSYNPKTKSVVVLTIAESAYVEVPKGYGSWKLGSVYSLGEENGDLGAQLVKQSTSKLLGLPIDGIVIFKDSENAAFSKNLEEWRKNKLSVLTFPHSIETDLTSMEIYQFVWALSGVRSDKILSLDLERSDITNSKLLPDSSRVLGVDNIKMDLFIRDKMPDSTIVEEGHSIAVFNATDHPGLALEAARIITNLGGNVIVTSNSNERLTDSLVSINDNSEEVSDSLTVKRLKQVFAPICLKDLCVSKDEKIISSRASINVVIGEDFYQYWHGK